MVNVAKGLEDGSYKRLRRCWKKNCQGGGSWSCPALPMRRRSAGARRRRLPLHPESGRRQKKSGSFDEPSSRLYVNDDVTGVELGGALKNVIALAAGIADGLQLGDNAKAALMTRGITEIARLGVAMGAKTETFAGLSGIGDLIVTCTSMHSRNRRAGILIARGKVLKRRCGKLAQ